MTKTERAIERLEVLKEHCGIQQESSDDPVWKDDICGLNFALAALRAQLAREKPHSLKSNDYPKEGQRVLFWDTLNSRWATGHYSCPHWEADDCRVEASHWILLPEPPKEGL